MESTSLTTPAGPLAVILHDDGALAAAGFCPITDLEARLASTSTRRAELGDIGRSVKAYLGGDFAALDRLDVRQPGSEHRQRVWAAMRRIPAGTTASYADLAEDVGLPRTASRAVGGACAANLIAPFVPCHRVVRTGAGLGGYYYGLEVKTWLLSHEGAVL